MGLNNSTWIKLQVPGIFAFLFMLSFPAFGETLPTHEKWTGRRIMEEVFTRHELFPYVFEAQTMIMMDGTGNRDVRKARRFSRVEKDGTVKYLLVFDHPAEVRGVALLAIRKCSGVVESGIYLPAFGKDLISSAGEARGTHFLGTDFAIEDLGSEVLSDFRYVRSEDRKINKIAHFVVDAFPKNREIERTTGYSLRRHFVRQDNFFIVRTDYFDRRERFFKRQTLHDLKRVSGGMWRANMILMEDHKERHKTLIKIDRRVFSHDYVPPEMFEHSWLMENRHIQSMECRIFKKGSRSSVKGEAGPADGPLNRESGEEKAAATKP
jgi:outer membrane lipoprotein-sorting protein